MTSCNVREIFILASTAFDGGRFRNSAAIYSPNAANESFAVSTKVSSAFAASSLNDLGFDIDDEMFDDTGDIPRDDVAFRLRRLPHVEFVEFSPGDGVSKLNSLNSPKSLKIE